MHWIGKFIGIVNNAKRSEIFTYSMVCIWLDWKEPNLNGNHLLTLLYQTEIFLIDKNAFTGCFSVALEEFWKREQFNVHRLDCISSLNQAHWIFLIFFHGSWNFWFVWMTLAADCNAGCYISMRSILTCSFRGRIGYGCKWR